MFNLQGGELIIILLLALVVLGPEKLPEAMRKAGSLYAELKKMSSGFQEEFRAAMNEPVKEMRETANMLRDSADFTKLRDGERSAKPHSAEMVAAADPEAAPVDEVPFEAADEPAQSGRDAASGGQPDEVPFEAADEPAQSGGDAASGGVPDEVPFEAADEPGQSGGDAASAVGEAGADEAAPAAPRQRWSFDLPAAGDVPDAADSEARADGGAGAAEEGRTE